MKGKGVLWLWVGVLLVFLAGAGFVTYKLVKRQQIRAEMQRWEIKSVLQLTRELSEEELAGYLEMENEKLDRYEVLRPIIDDLNLVEFWGVPDVDAALAQLKKCAEIRPGDNSTTVVFAVSDKDKGMAEQLAREISKSYTALRLREQLRPPMPPPGYLPEGN